MHIFYDSNLQEWKLIIGELPVLKNRSFDPTGNYREAQVRYNSAIAALKQNALTVGNPELAVFQPKGFNPDTKDFYFHGHLVLKDFQVKPDELYLWPGSYETKCEHPCMCTIRIQDGVNYNYNCKEVAILKLPEENSAKETERIFSGSAEEILDSLKSTDDGYYHHSQIEPVIKQLREALKELIPLAERFTGWIYENCDKKDFDNHNEKISNAKKLIK